MSALLNPSLGFETASASELLAWALETYGGEFAIATSFQKEGMAILDIAARISSRVRVFTLDTGRLPAETFRMIEIVRERYGIDTEVVQPDAGEIRSLVALRGRDLFYESVDARRAWTKQREIGPEGAVLVRPDRYIGFRSAGGTDNHWWRLCIKSCIWRRFELPLMRR